MVRDNFAQGLTLKISKAWEDVNPSIFFQMEQKRSPSASMQKLDANNTIFIIMREFHDFEKIQIRSSRADLHHRLGNWNSQMAITYSNLSKLGI